MASTQTSVALITGGASGIGFAIARKLISRGSTFALVDLYTPGIPLPLTTRVLPGLWLLL